MKKIFFLSLLSLLFFGSFAQQKPKSNSKDKPPTQKEMDDMMKELQGAMDDMSPEDKKAMDSMGIKVKVPTSKDIPKMSDKQLADAWEAEGRIVPKKDVMRIAKIAPTPTTAALPAFISRVHAAVVATMKAEERTDVESIYKTIRQNPSISTANVAISYWLNGQPLLATYLMGKACQDVPADIDNINNYAVMLTMTGAEQAALPILQNLNQRFPKNSTVLNNLGQAWFGLGDISKADKYLDSAIRIYTYHSQANYTKSLIEESKGNTNKAIEALERSIKKSHSPEKESRLRKLGKKLSGKDVDFPFRMPQDPLGLEKFTWPAYPRSVKQSVIQEEAWRLFKDLCNEELTKLNSRARQLEKIAGDATEKRMKAIIAASNSGKMVNPLPWYAPVAILKLNYLVEDKDNGTQFRMEKSGKAMAEVFLNDAEWDKARTDAEEIINKHYEPLIGEGRPNPLKQYCEDINKVRDEYLQKANTPLESSQRAYMDDERKYINNMVYYAQYINWPEDFEVIKIGAKIRWLNLIKNQVVRFMAMGPDCVPEEKKPGKMVLQAFDDVACKYHSSSDIGLMEFNNDCSRLEAKFKLPGVHYSRKIDSDDHDKLLAASLELTISASKGWEKGPVQAEVKAEMTGKLEWNDKNITNWEVTSEVGVSAGSNLGYGDKSIDIVGAKARIGMDGSSSVSGKGILQNMNISNK